MWSDFLVSLLPYLYKVGLPILVLWRLYHVEKSNIKKDLIIEQHEQNLHATQTYNKSLEEQMERSDLRDQKRKEALQSLAPNDPRWNELLFEDATVLDTIHTDPTILERKGNKT